MNHKISLYFTACVVVFVFLWISFPMFNQPVNKIELHNSKIIDIARPLVMEGDHLFLESDLTEVLDLVNSTVMVPLADNQRAALVSFAFNVKRAEFIESALVESLNDEKYKAVPGELARCGIGKKAIALWLTP